MEEVFDNAVVVELRRDEVIDTKNKAFLVIEGAIGQYASGANGEKILFVFKPQEFFPLQSQTKSVTTGRSYIFKAFGPAKLLQMPYKDFLKRVTLPAYADKFAACVFSVMQHQLDRIDNLQEEQVRERLLERLIYLAHRFGTATGDRTSIDVPMSHADLAALINTTRESVNRHMKFFERQGIITVHRKKVRIHSLKAIKKMLEDHDTYHGFDVQAIGKSALVLGVFVSVVAPVVMTELF